MTGSNKNFDSANNNRPNLVPGQNAFLDPHRSRAAAAAQWFNTGAFTSNGPGLGIGPYGADGNAPRDYLRAPGYRDIDLGIFRNVSFERFTLQLRGKATNAFNMVSLNAPTANLASSLNGKITAAASPRLIQVGARLTFSGPIGGPRFRLQNPASCRSRKPFPGKVRGTADRSASLRRKTFPRRVRRTADPSASPGFPVESCGFGQPRVVLFRENHIRGTGESCEVGNPGSLQSKNIPKKRHQHRDLSAAASLRSR